MAESIEIPISLSLVARLHNEGRISDETWMYFAELANEQVMEARKKRKEVNDYNNRKRRNHSRPRRKGL